MRLQLHRCLITTAACVLTLAPAKASAQSGDYLQSEATAAPIVRGVPFSADGVVTLRLVLFDGTRIERTVPARYFRDSEGRVRREQTIMGLAPINPLRESQAVVTMVDPVAGFVYTLVGDKQEAQRMRLRTGAEPRAASLPGIVRMDPRISTVAQSLGTRDFDGIQATGQRMTSTIPAGVMGNDRPIEVVDEVWTAQDLRLEILRTHRDPRTGDFEIRFTKISRAEPSADLFRIPAGYKIVDIPGAGK